MNLCACGCGTACNKKFVRGHWPRGKTLSEETRKKIGKAVKQSSNVDGEKPKKIRLSSPRNDHTISTSVNDELYLAVVEQALKNGMRIHIWMRNLLTKFFLELEKQQKQKREGK